ncbi:hypothetical protein M0R45_009187 [Rubus argutus]|uniref:Plastocyanin-like domain-containing protein n=1 Tax=Rubus argutus TaxID=59490 RepID=A0AAW1Y385_RUBAR
MFLPVGSMVLTFGGGMVVAASHGGCVATSADNGCKHDGGLGLLHPSLLFLGFLLSLHGVRQPRNPWSDGPENITQCPIQAGSNFTYEVVFPVKKEHYGGMLIVIGHELLSWSHCYFTGRGHYISIWNAVCTSNDYFR